MTADDGTGDGAGRRPWGRGLVRRTVYLLAGAAIALGFLILASSVYAPLQPSDAADLQVFLPLLLVPMLGVGLLPGVREVQVAGVQTLLGVEDVVVPAPMLPRHRWRTALWTFVHQVVGLVVGLAVLGAALATATLVGLLLGVSLTVPESEVVVPGSRRRVELGFVLEPPTDLAGWLLVCGVVAAVLLLALVLVLAAGAGATWSAPLLLGPTGDDRLALAERRLAEEREYRRLSRDLHDGVGHSLSAISLQAAAARRVLERSAEEASGDDGRMLRSLEAIETLAGRAVGELDHALGVLRRDIGGEHDPVAGRRPVEKQRPLDGAGLERLDALAQEHRSHGADVRLEVGPAALDVPAVAGRTAYRVCAEALTNAARHGDREGPVTVTVTTAGAHLVVEVVNPLASPASRQQQGRGLRGLAEAVELVGGSFSAGPVDGRWRVEARLPVGTGG